MLHHKNIMDPSHVSKDFVTLHLPMLREAALIDAMWLSVPPHWLEV